MGEKQEEEFNYGSFMDDRYVPTTPKVCKISSSIPENLTASFQNLLNKRINDNYKVRKRQTFTECFTILKFTIIFIIFITTCKLITLFFDIEQRVEQFNSASQSPETIRICFYSLFIISLIVQFVESYAIVSNNLCLTLVFTSIEFMIIAWAMFDNYHSKDEHWLIYLWTIGLVILSVHLAILYKMKFRRSKSKKSKRSGGVNDKEQLSNHSESDQLYVPQQDCSYSDFLTQKQYDTKAAAYVAQPFVQTTIDMPTIVTISQTIGCKEADGTSLSNEDSNLVKFVDDEEEAQERRELLCKELLEQCQMKIKFFEMSQCNNQLILDQQNEPDKLDTHNCECSGECSSGESNQISEFNSPKLSSSSSCSDETCRERRVS